MFEKTFRKPGRQWLWFPMLFCVLLVWGCHKDTKPKPTAYQSRLYQEIKKVVVMGFRAAMTEGPGPNLVENPITGTSFLAEPVSEDAVRQMNKILFSKLIEGDRKSVV